MSLEKRADKAGMFNRFARKALPYMAAGVIGLGAYGCGEDEKIVGVPVNVDVTRPYTVQLSERGDADAEVSTSHPANGNNSARLYANLITGPVNEGRIGITPNSPLKLSDLENISWEVRNGSGYAPHVDVFLDNGEVLTFEYAKVDSNDCDDAADYPIGDFNTFADKGIVDSNAFAWRDIPGPCGDSSFDAQHKSLADWKSVYPNANVLRAELEADGWISQSEAYVDDVKINDGKVTGFE